MMMDEMRRRKRRKRREAVFSHLESAGKENQ